MKTYYFTYGLENYPYVGGWTEVVVDGDLESAINAFCAVHPIKYETIDCASMYDEEDFKKTKMYENGNFNRKCMERIIVNVEKVEK